MLRYLWARAGTLLLLSTSASLVSGAAGLGILKIISQVISVDPMHSLRRLAMAFFGVCAVFIVSKTYAEIALIRLTHLSAYSLRVEISNRILTASPAHIRRIGRHGLLTILTRDVEAFVNYLAGAPSILGNAVVITGCLAWISWLSLPVAIAIVALLFITGIGMRLYEKTPLELLNAARAATENLNKAYRGLIDGSRELHMDIRKASSFVDFVIEPAAQAVSRLFVAALRIYAWQINAGSTMFYIAIGAVIFIAPRMFHISRADSLIISIILLYLVRPTLELMGAIPMVRQAEIAFQRITNLTFALAGAEVRNAIEDPFPNKLPTNLCISELIFSYEAAGMQSGFCVGPFTLEVNSGEVVFLIGGNGTGKTTLGMLLAGLLEPDSGTLCLNGVLITTGNIAHYRNRVSVVFADFFLFEHIFPKTEHSERRACEYLERFGMNPKVEIRHGKFSTIDLSSGERKRLALVAAYLDDKSIYIFDEWAADQDPMFKEIFYREILGELKAAGKAILVITHDDSYFHCADRLIRLEREDRESANKHLGKSGGNI